MSRICKRIPQPRMVLVKLSVSGCKRRLQKVFLCKDHCDNDGRTSHGKLKTFSVSWTSRSTLCLCCRYATSEEDYQEHSCGHLRLSHFNDNLRSRRCDLRPQGIGQKRRGAKDATPISKYSSHRNRIRGRI